MKTGPALAAGSSSSWSAFQGDESDKSFQRLAVEIHRTVKAHLVPKCMYRSSLSRR